MTQTTLTLAMMGIVGVTFLVLHLLLRAIPYDETSPRERWPWPVWSWYPLALGFGLLAALAGNLYWIQRTPDHGNVAEDPGWENDIQPVRGEDARDDATPTPAPTKEQSRLVPRKMPFLAQANAPISGDSAAATPVGTPANAQPGNGEGPAWAEPGGTPIPDPFATPIATSSATPTATASPSPSPSPSPTPSTPR